MRDYDAIGPNKRCKQAEIIEMVTVAQQMCMT